MKKPIGLILTIISFTVFVLLYLFYDSKGYEYGLGCNFCNKSMPYNLKPNDGSDFSFTLKDEDDFELVGRGFRYEITNFKIKDFLSYGYNDNSVVIKCTDSLDNVKYLIPYETGYKNKKGNPEISFKEITQNDFKQFKDDYKWFEVDKKEGYAVDRNKFLSMLGALLSLSFIIYTSIQKLKRTTRLN